MNHNKTTFLPCFEAKKSVQAFLWCNGLCLLLFCCLLHGMNVMQHERQENGRQCENMRDKKIVLRGGISVLHCAYCRYTQSCQEREIK